MDIRKVKKLIEMLENSNLEEIEIKEGEESVRLVKSLGSPQSFQPQSIVLPQEAQPEVAPQAIETPEEVVKDSNSINSPMVGTFMHQLLQVPNLLFQLEMLYLRGMLFAL